MKEVSTVLQFERVVGVDDMCMVDIHVRGTWWPADPDTGHHEMIGDLEAFRDSPYGEIEEYLDEDEENEAIEALKAAVRENWND